MSFTKVYYSRDLLTFSGTCDFPFNTQSLTQIELGFGKSVKYQDLLSFDLTFTRYTFTLSWYLIGV
jgi:hypothetical protein